MHRHTSKNILHSSSFTKADKKSPSVCIRNSTKISSQVRPQSTLCMMRTEDIIKDIPHPGHHLFELQVNPHMNNQAGKKTLQILLHDWILSLLYLTHLCFTIIGVCPTFTLCHAYVYNVIPAQIHLILFYILKSLVAVLFFNSCIYTFKKHFIWFISLYHWSLSCHVVFLTYLFIEICIKSEDDTAGSWILVNGHLLFLTSVLLHSLCYLPPIPLNLSLMITRVLGWASSLCRHLIVAHLTFSKSDKHILISELKY